MTDQDPATLGYEAARDGLSEVVRRLEAGGLSLEDVIGIAAELQATARVDFFNMTGPGYHTFHLSIPAIDGPRDGWLAEASGAFRATVGGTAGSRTSSPRARPTWSR